MTVAEDELLVLEAEINKEAAKIRIRNQIATLEKSLQSLED